MTAGKGHTVDQREGMSTAFPIPCFLLHPDSPPQVFSGEKTNLSDEFVDFEKEVEVRRIGIERSVSSSLSPPPLL